MRGNAASALCSTRSLRSAGNVTREQPKLRAFISDLEQEREKKQEEIKALEAEIDGLYQQEDERARLRDINARRGKVVGRISLWIESVENDTESEKQEQIVKGIEERIKEIDDILDRDSVDCLLYTSLPAATVHTRVHMSRGSSTTAASATT